MTAREGEQDLPDRLEAEGRLTEAIDLLMARNRARRDPDVERRIVQLRAAAGGRVDRAAQGDMRPAEGGPLCEAGDIPEIAPGRLDAGTLAAGIRFHGALIVRGLVDGSRTGELREGIDEALRARMAWREGGPEDGREGADRGWFDPLEPGEPGEKEVERRFLERSGSLFVADSPSMAFEVLETFGRLGIVEVVAAYLGVRPVLSLEKWTMRRVPRDAQPGWHQDGAFLGRDVRSVNLWIALSDCGVDAPGLDLVPRQFDRIVETGTEGARYSWSVGDGVVERVRGGLEIRRPVFRAGDAVLFDHMNLHRTAIGEGMKKDRYALETWFFAPSHFPKAYHPLYL